MSCQVRSSHPESKSFVAHFNNAGYYQAIRAMWLTTQKLRKNHLKNRTGGGKNQ